MERVEVVVVGGGAAGLAAALTLARACRTVMVFDDGAPRNAASSSVHGFLSRDGATPAALLGAAREQLSPYPGVSIRDARVSRIIGDIADGFTLEAYGGRVHAARVILATGRRDDLPSLSGFAALWGRDIFHCPYCHGWEAASRRWGIVAYDRPDVAGKVRLFRNWTDDLMMFGGDDAGLEAGSDLDMLCVPVERRPIVGLETDDAGLCVVTVDGGGQLAPRALVWPVRQRLPELVTGLGLAFGRDAHGHVLVDETQQTSQPGIFAAGDVSSCHHQQVIHAASSGVAAAKAAVNSLTHTRWLAVSVT